MIAPNLDKLFNPRNIAFIGASKSLDKWGFIVLMNTLKANYRGDVYPINPRETSILGYKCYPRVADIPGSVDVAFITTQAPVVPQLIDECGAKSIPFAVILSANFSETGQEGAELEREVIIRAKRYGIRVIGPNMMGIYSRKTSLHATMPPIMPLHGSVSMFSQSGNVGAQMLAWGMDESVGFEKYVSSGNEADLCSADYLRYFAQDADTKVTLAYIEGIDRESDFFEAACEVAHIKPIVVYKGGRTRAGEKAAASHSGAMAGSSRVCTAAFRQAGIIHAETGQEMIDCAKAFSHCPIPRGNRVGIITRGGGWGVMAADLCEENGLDVVPLSQDLLAEIDSMLPSYWSRGNPVDLVATINSDPFPRCLEIMARWDGVDAVLALGVGMRGAYFPVSPELKEPQELLDFIAWIREVQKESSDLPDETLVKISELVQETGKPIIAVSVPLGGGGASALLQRYGVVAYQTPDRAVRALKLLCDYGRFLQVHTK